MSSRLHENVISICKMQQLASLTTAGLISDDFMKSSPQFTLHETFCEFDKTTKSCQGKQGRSK